MSFIPIMDSAKCRQCKGAKPAHGAYGQQKKRQTSRVGEALDRVIPSVGHSRSGPQQEPHAEDDGFTTFVPLDVEFEESMPPPEQRIVRLAPSNAIFLQSIHNKRHLHQGDHWRDVVIVHLIQIYMECMRIYHSKLPACSSLVLTGLLLESCNCGESHCTLHVLAIYWDHHESINIITCCRRPAADQLVARGLFPCAPY